MSTLKFVQRAGKYHYFRYPGVPRARLRGVPDSLEYLAHYRDLLAVAQNPDVVAFPNPRRSVGRPLKATTPLRPADDDDEMRHIEYAAGTVGWVAKKFIDSRWAFKDKYKAGTAEGHRLCLKFLCDYKRAGQKGRFGFVRMEDITPDVVQQFCAEVAERHGTARADQCKRMLSLSWQFAATLRECRIDRRFQNPASRIKALHKVRKPHRKWPEHIQETFLDGAPAHLRLAFHLARHTGFRCGDVCALKWSQYDEKRSKLIVETEKTGEAVPMHVTPELRAILAKTPRVSEYILSDAKGRRFRKQTLGRLFTKRLRAIGAKGYTLHGLRVTMAVWAAENGAGVQALMFLLGHTNPKQALHYAREATKERVIEDALAFAKAPQRKRGSRVA